MAPPSGRLAKAPVSTSRDLVPVGKRDVIAKNPTRRDENGNKPLTAKALVLRNGKYGARGTGELVAVGKMSGREKLELLAEDAIEQSKKALGTPFRLEECAKIADSMLAASLDEISDLQDPDLFQAKIEAEVRARTPHNLSGNAVDPFRNASNVSSIVAARIHNAYMMASAWRIIGDTLRDLAEAGVEDSLIKSQLKKDANLRDKYLVLYDIVNVVAQAGQAKFALLATTAPHYHQYFKRIEEDDLDEPEYVFDWSALKDVHKSFIDSIIVELCLPQSSMPKQILYQILHDAIAETPRDAKRFPQALWDAVGDLSVVVQLQEYLESPLLGPDGEAWKKLPRQMPEDYEDWVDGQVFSGRASKMCANFKDTIYPLSVTKKSHVLQHMWKSINLNYKAECGQDIDTLWHLDDLKDRTPQWHAIYVPRDTAGFDHDSDDDRGPLVRSGKPGGKRKAPLAITNGDGDESAGSMPSLQSVSDSSDEVDFDESDSYDEDEEDEDDGESGYDTDEEDALREMLREAMDTAIANEYLDHRNAAPDADILAEERKGNPFLKLLGSLRGRMFSSNPTLKTTDRTTPRHAFAATAPAAPPPPGAPDVASTEKPAPSTTTGSQSRKATVETVEDEEEVAAAKNKKKKKSKKKKKPSTASEPATPDLQQGTSMPQAPTTPAIHAASEGQAAGVRPSAPSAQTKNGVPATPSTANASKPVRQASVNSSTATLTNMSTTSLPLQQTQSAQSARKYLQTEGLNNSKTKIKSRPDYANLVPIPEKKKGLFNRFGKKDKTEEDTVSSKQGSKFSFFHKLSSKAKVHMHQLLNTSEDEKRGLAPMKWENFLKVMREMGFTYDPSTAGSSVRFDPPDPRDTPITFHKPHPDPTLQPVKLKEYSKRLKRCYGWSEEDFYKAATAA
ncbi:uncharacterized protein LAESUDRAFT_734491 [Laetiporus sulphureus 93-53]|uniref:Uncharacterized protein n=1 Tax=Laetiporus sulphureus 93-53 TaxID=1314785 RepID=A0A165GQT1_9APHY|nr:uncharacterized protein LAESUDRAFT_734491 [Laetiporus sulphureus 93-53]KZT10678.1 hypothetical protein LAESUDRAFT_734491 [Laetiporus sulphureus 93-53]